MEFAEKEIHLKNGKVAVLCAPKPERAEEMLTYFKQTTAQTHFLLRSPEECDMTIAQEAAFLDGILSSDSAVMICCYVDGILVGNCQITRKNRLKNRHRASIGIAILKDYWGLGIGTAMFQEMLEIAKVWGVMQVELEVIEGNTRAMGLYEKMGFQTVASTPNAIRLEDGTMLKEYKMVKCL